MKTLPGVDKRGHVHPGQAIQHPTKNAFPQVTTQIAHPRVRGEGGSGVDMSTFVHPGIGSCGDTHHHLKETR